MEISATLLPSLPTPTRCLPCSSSSSSLASSNSLYLNNKFYKKTNNLILKPCQKRNGSSSSGFSCRSMFGLGVPEIVVIAGVTTLLFGPKMVPELGKSIGQTVKSFQQIRSWRLYSDGSRPSRTLVCVCGGYRRDRVVSQKQLYPQNVDLPPILPRDKKKPYPIPIKKMHRAARTDKEQAQLGIEKVLETPKNGLVVTELVPVAYRVLNAWKALIKGIAQLLHVVPVHGCSLCPEVHIGKIGHDIQDCRGTNNGRRRSYHTWVKGSINDILLPVESYHLYDPFGRRIKHETRFDYDRIPAVVELCIQAGVDLPDYPSRRRTQPIRMIGKKIIDRGGFLEEPKPRRSVDSVSPLAELDTFGIHVGKFPPPVTCDVENIAQQTIKAYETVRFGVQGLMKRYSVKACGYCSEIHVGQWGHNAKLCGAFKHQWRDGKHGWQDATINEVFPPNYVWHVQDPNGPPLRNALKMFYGKTPAVIELCVQAGAVVPEKYKPMMRLDIVVPDAEEKSLVV